MMCAPAARRFDTNYFGSAAEWDVMYNASGFYTGSNFIIPGYLGDWVVIGLPNPILLSGFNLYWLTS
jgi:hypothetical protein